MKFKMVKNNGLTSITDPLLHVVLMFFSSDTLDAGSSDGLTKESKETSIDYLAVISTMYMLFITFCELTVFET